MPKVYSRRNSRIIPADAIYVGRPSRWGNPYTIEKYGRGNAIDKFRVYAESMRADIIKCLKGKDLVCWCAPDPCHADVLLEIANETPDN